jgi:hypothetical protein
LVVAGCGGNAQGEVDDRPRATVGRDVAVKVVDGSGYTWPAVEADAEVLAE